MNTLYTGFSRVDITPIMEHYEEGSSSSFKAGITELLKEVQQ